MDTDHLDLQRFVSAQDAQGTYTRATAELQAGLKTSHWMWFVFPQVSGLASSATARTYALPNVEAARAYLAHPVLGPRLRHCTDLLISVEQRSAEEILGVVDAMKLRSSLTLFLRAAPRDPLFALALSRFFDGVADEATDELL